MERVFLRADLNVPLDGTTIIDDHKLLEILPTIEKLKANGNKIILATHIGRPTPGDKANFFEASLSTKLLIPWLESHGLIIDYEIDLLIAAKKSRSEPNKILLLENLRFFKGERETNQEFARLLAQCADSYVNDAFGVIHRTDTSVTLLADEFPKEKRSFGPLVEKELNSVKKLKDDPQQPFVIVMGGSKIETKIEVIDQFLEQPNNKRVRTILIGGAISNSPLTQKLLEKAKKYDVNIILPIDSVKKNNQVVDIGPETINLFTEEIKKSKTIFANGTMGIYEQESSSLGSKKILEAIAIYSKNSFIGGGDAVAATYKFGLASKMKFLSTGGGAFLTCLAVKNLSQLPAVTAMQNN